MTIGASCSPIRAWSATVAPTHAPGARPAALSQVAARGMAPRRAALWRRASTDERCHVRRPPNGPRRVVPRRWRSVQADRLHQLDEVMQLIASQQRDGGHGRSECRAHDVARRCLGRRKQRRDSSRSPPPPNASAPENEADVSATLPRVSAEFAGGHRMSGRRIRQPIAPGKTAMGSRSVATPADCDRPAERAADTDHDGSPRAPIRVSQHHGSFACVRIRSSPVETIT